MVRGLMRGYQLVKTQLPTKWSDQSDVSYVQKSPNRALLVLMGLKGILVDLMDVQLWYFKAYWVNMQANDHMLSHAAGMEEQ